MYRTIVVAALVLSVSCAGKQSVNVDSHPPVIYYVSPTGSDSNNGTAGAPLRTIQKAETIVKPGDTVIVKDGIYTDTNSDGDVIKIARGGTAGNWITFKAESKWGAVLDCQNNTANYAIHSISTHSNYIAFEDFEIKECKKMAAIFNLGEHDIRFTGNYIHDIARHVDDTLIGLPAVYAGSGARYTFDSNIFHTIGRLNPHTAPSASEASCTTPPDYVFKGVAYSNLNACYNHDHALYLVSTNNVIVNNIFYDLKSGWAVMSGGSGDIIVNNTFVGDNPGRLGQILVKKAETMIANNIFYNDGDCGILTYSWRCGGSIKNNLFYPHIDILCTSEGRTSKGTWTFSNNISRQDPKFVNPTGRDFHLQAGSPAIRNGDAKIAPELDHDKKRRPKDEHCAIGAYEH